LSFFRMLCAAVFVFAWVSSAAHAGSDLGDDFHLSEDCAVCFTGSNTPDPDSLIVSISKPVIKTGIVDDALVLDVADRFVAQLYLSRAPPHAHL